MPSEPFFKDIPYDGSLDIMPSETNVANLIRNDLEQLKRKPLGLGEKIKFLVGTRNPFPDDLTLAKFSNRVYSEGTKNLPFPSSDWKLLATANSNRTGYFGAAYWNSRCQQIVIAHRGTIFNLKCLIADISIWRNTYTPQISSAATFVAFIQKIVLPLNSERNTFINVSITGHSLGGWLAQITTLSIEYLEDTNIGDSRLYVLRKTPAIHAHTVVFESPGGYDMLRKIQNGCSNRYESIIKFKNLDITVIVSNLNVINTVGRHAGKLYSIETTPMQYYFYLWHTLRTHGIEQMVEALEKGIRRKEVKDWPAVDLLLSEFPSAQEAMTQAEPPAITTYRKHRMHYEFEAKDNRYMRSVFSFEEFVFFQTYMENKEKVKRFLSQKLSTNVDCLILGLKSVEYNDHDHKVIVGKTKNDLNNTVSYLKNTLHFIPEVKEVELVSKPEKFENKRPVLEFVGRENEMSEIKNNLPRKFVVLTGSQGVGKSELAVKLMAADCYKLWNGIWINATSKNHLNNSFSKLFAKLGLGKGENHEEIAIERKLAKIYDKLNGKTLLIFDDANNLDDIDSYFPHTDYDNYHILITSKSSQWSSRRIPLHVIEITSLTNAKAAELITKNISETPDITNAEKLAHRLRNHPLALAQAAAFIDIKTREFGRHYTIANYIQEIKNQQMANSADAINVTLRLSLNRLETSEGGVGLKASGMVQMLGCFASDPVSEKIFLGVLTNSDAEIKQMVRLLEDYFLVRSNDGFLEMHPLARKLVIDNVKATKNEARTIIFRSLAVLLQSRESFQSFESFTSHYKSIRSHMTDAGLTMDAFFCYSTFNKEKLMAFWKRYLKWTVKIGDSEAVKTTLHTVRERDPRGLTAELNLLFDNNKTHLHEATYNGFPDIAMILLSYGAKPNVQDKDGATPLHFHATNSEEISTALIKIFIHFKADVNAMNKWQWSVMHGTCQAGFLKAVQLLVENNARVDIKNDACITPLHVSLRSNRHDNLDLVKYLVKNGANVNAQDNKGKTILHIACTGPNNAELVKFLLQQGAKENITTKSGFTAFSYAEVLGNKNITAVLRDRSNIQQLAKRLGVIFCDIVEMRNLDNIKLFVNQNPNSLNDFNDAGWTGLHLAAGIGDAKIVEYLVGKTNININLKSANGFKYTPLHWACEHGFIDVIKILLKHKACRHIRDGSDWTPVEIARRYGCAKAVQVIEKFAAKNRCSCQKG